VKENDYEYFHDLLSSSVCHLCNEGFTTVNRPTLDRKNNSKDHSKEHIRPCCYCNTFKANNDEEMTRLFIQLKKFVQLNGLPFTLSQGQEDLYWMIRKGVTGGLSNVHNRLNIRGETTIHKLEYTNHEVEVKDTGSIVTNIIGVDFNSLYPFSYSSVHHSFNPYTDGIMYMPGYVKFHTKNKKEALRVIGEKKELFIVSVKGHIPERYWNENVNGEYTNVINFPPIIRNLDIHTDELTIGETTYNYMKENKLPTNRKEKTLTQILNTQDQFMVFSSYYL
jgi:hypothetical protein